MTASTDTHDPNLGKIYGHCRLERLLGEGGMGRVYLATHTTLNKLVAVKVLRSDLTTDPHAADRFLREARSAAKVEHPAVVQVYDIGQAVGTFYIVMQFVEGTTLEEVVRKHGMLPVPDSIRIMKAVCEGVRVAHQRGVIHRDIKPDNILLGKDGSVKLADFGLARAIEGDPNLSQTGRVFGTPHYMSPEQALGEKVDQRSDIFSLGATFYRIVAGAYPFPATSAMAVVYKLTHETPQPAREVNPEVPGPVSDLIARMMARKPSDRISSVDEVIRRLEVILSAKPTSAAERTAAESRRPAPREAPKPPARRPAARGRGGSWRIAFLAVAALVAAGVLVLRRYNLIPPLETLIAMAKQRVQGPGEEPAGAAETVAAARAAASMAAGEEPAGSEPGSTAGRDLLEDELEPRSDSGSSEIDPLKVESDATLLEARRALERRAAAFLLDLQEDPSRLGRYLDPQLRTGRADALLLRIAEKIRQARAKGAPPLSVGEVALREGGLAARVAVRGPSRPVVLSWIRRQGEWYFAPQLRRAGDAKG